jgi:hypothetical protein
MVYGRHMAIIGTDKDKFATEREFCGIHIKEIMQHFFKIQ